MPRWPDESAGTDQTAAGRGDGRTGHRRRYDQGVRRTRRPEHQIFDGLAVTPVARTILDLADLPGTRLDDVISWCARACQKGLTTPEKLGRALETRPRHRRRAQLRLIPGDVGEGIESLAEYRFLHRVVSAHGLPRRRMQVVRGNSRADFDNDEFGVRTEVDGQLWHAVDRFHADRWRDRKSTVEGVASPLEAVVCEGGVVITTRGSHGRLWSRCGNHTASWGRAGFTGRGRSSRWAGQRR